MLNCTHDEVRSVKAHSRDGVIRFGIVGFALEILIQGKFCCCHLLACLSHQQSQSRPHMGEHAIALV